MTESSATFGVTAILPMPPGIEALVEARTALTLVPFTLAMWLACGSCWLCKLVRAPRSVSWFRDGIDASTVAANVHSTILQLQDMGFTTNTTDFRINSRGLAPHEYKVLTM